MRRLIRTLLIINGVLLFLPALVLFDMFGLVNAFIIPFTVANESTQHIRVSPLGSLGGEGEPHYLPLFDRRSPAIRSRRLNGFELAPGEARTFLYDMDDVSLTDILIEAGGRVLQLSVSDGLDTPPSPDKQIIIADLDRIPPASPKAAALARQADTSGRMLNRLLLLPAVSFAVLLILRWRSRPSSSTGLSETTETGTLPI